MAKEFQEYLEGLLKGKGTGASERYVAAAQGDRNPDQLATAQLMARLLARAKDREHSLGGLEDFIIGPLPSNMTLYEPINIIQTTKDFYGEKGLELDDHSIINKGWGEILMFKGKGVRGMVQFDLGEGYRSDGQYELWVTANFSPENNWVRKSKENSEIIN